MPSFAQTFKCFINSHKLNHEVNGKTLLILSIFNVFNKIYFRLMVRITRVSNNTIKQKLFVIAQCRAGVR